MSDTKPHPCPQCGSAPNVRKIVPEGKAEAAWRVFCPKCRKKSKGWDATRTAAIRAWNWLGGNA